jgi:hypothetical protein
VALLGVIDRGQDLDAGRRHHAEHDEAGAAEHALRHRSDDEGELRNEAEHQHDDAAGDADPAAIDAGDADEADILRV